MIDPTEYERLVTLESMVRNYLSPQDTMGGKTLCLLNLKAYLGISEAWEEVRRPLIEREAAQSRAAIGAPFVASKFLTSPTSPTTSPTTVRIRERPR